MKHKIKTVYVVHHSHTDIGYTDLQERILDEQAHYIQSAVEIMNGSKENKAFRWNCETYFCVEQFLNSVGEKEKEDFFRLVKTGEIGISASYLNFNDLLDASIFHKRVHTMCQLFKKHDIEVKTAMIADINGISMGQRDALLDNGIEFLFTNIHTHHGMYPLYQNQNAYWWENAVGKRMLVWNGEHYNLGNALGIKPNRMTNFMTDNYFGSRKEFDASIEVLKTNLDKYLLSCEEQGYPYDFIISGVSGVFSDNAPPSLEILRTIEGYQEKYGENVCIQMVSLQELYTLIKEKVSNVPVYKGDLTDWWANGVGSTPYAVKHYKEAQKIYHLCKRLDKDAYLNNPEQAKIAEDNLLVYAEHTWGHSSTITNPYDTMVVNLDMRKNSYASKAHESASLMLGRTALKMGDTMRYYNTNGKIKVINTGNQSGKMLVEFYIETMLLKEVKLICLKDNREVICQLSGHPRGVRISFADAFLPREEKEYSYTEVESCHSPVNTRKVYIGAERVKDIVNEYDPITYRLPYELENKWFKIQYNLKEGITSFYNKKDGCEMMGEGLSRFFTPIYERTKIRTDPYEERRLIGRNIRGLHAKQYQGKLTGIRCLEQGKLFTTMEFTFRLTGTRYCSVIVTLYEEIPKIDFKLKIAKELSDDIESVYMPLTLSLPEREIYLEKGTEPFRPGIDQLPGTCMEYYMSDYGMLYQTSKGGIIINSPDVPLYYMGIMGHHPIKLCDGKPENNQRDIYSWVMNNTWETNFKMDLSGFGEFCYSIHFSEHNTPEANFEKLFDDVLGTYTIIIE